MWLLEKQTQGMCSIRGNRMHSLKQLPANPVARSHTLALITAQVGIHTSTSHSVFPSHPLSLHRRHFLVRAFVCSSQLCQYESSLMIFCLFPLTWLCLINMGLTGKQILGDYLTFWPWRIYIAPLIIGKRLQSRSLLKSASQVRKYFSHDMTRSFDVSPDYMFLPCVCYSIFLIFHLEYLENSNTSLLVITC